MRFSTLRDDQIQAEAESDRSERDNSDELLFQRFFEIGNQNYVLNITIIKEIAYIEVKGTNKKPGYPFYIHLITLPLVVIKFLSSAGVRLYNLLDFFYSEGYIFTPFMKLLPLHVSYTFIGYCILADALMNLMTRGPSTYKMVDAWGCWRRCCCCKDHAYAASQNEVSENWRRAGIKNVVKFCSVVETFGASLGAFLGTVTIFKKIFYLENKIALVSIGSSVFFANFFTNFAYRVRKAGDNALALYDGRLRRPTISEIMTILLATGANIATSYYGSSHAMKEFLGLIDVYPEEASIHDEDSFWEDFINNMLNVTQPLSATSFIFSQCVNMLAPDPVRIPNSSSAINLPLAVIRRSFYQILKNVGGGVWLAWMPKLIRIFGIWLTKFCVPGEMLGNGILVLNDSLEFLIKRITSNPYVAVTLAFLFTAVNARIYWHFNIPDWIANAQNKYVRTIFSGLQTMGLWSPSQGTSELVTLLTPHPTETTALNPAANADASEDHGCCAVI